MIRIGRVAKTIDDKGMVVVVFEDRDSMSLPLPMLTFNNEVSLPDVGELVVTLHMANGSSKGFCLGTYHGADTGTDKSYKKTYDGAAFSDCGDGHYKLKTKTTKLESEEITLSCAKGNITLTELLTRLDEAEKKIKEHEARISTLEGGG